MEENRRISWSDLFIKVILVVIFILFTVWLLSLSNKELSNSLNVLTDDIFSQNIEKMKNVGKEYFTIERLPEKVGDVKTLTLEEMYEKKLILELRDKYGNACDKADSYISIEKFDNEYQMKVYLECASDRDHIIVIMGCYDYCDNDICEVKKEDVKQIEYEYKKSTGGYWTDYGKWSEWSKNSISKTDYRQVETKKETEKYSYDKVIVDTVYEKFEATCPEGYKKTDDGTKCYKTTTDNSYQNPVCPTVSGYSVKRDGFNCSYTKTVTKTADPVCPTVSGYTYTGRSGFTCNYTKSTSKTADPICPTVSGYTYTGRNGFTCNYKRTVTSSNYTLSYVTTKTGSSIPADTSTYDYVKVDADYVYDCNNSCAFKWVYTYKVYKKVYGTTTETTTKTASCPSGYTNKNGTCTKTTTETTTKTASCPTGYESKNGVCTNSSIDKLSKTASCPSGYTKSGNSCVKTIKTNDYKDLNKVCPTGFNKTQDGTKCYKEVSSTVLVEGTKEVTYYRYRVREYKGGSVSYKWSTSKNDKKLLDAGYKLTGRTR